MLVFQNHVELANLKNLGHRVEMGKQKRERLKPHKENPTGLPSVKDIENAESEDFVNEDRETALQKIYEDILSPSIEEKLSALQTLESMACAADISAQVAKDGIAKMIGPLLVDHSVPVRAAAATALRCIAQSNKTNAYTQLVKDDIMTPLSALLKQYHTEWQPKQSQKCKGPIDDHKIAFVEAVTLLWTLCENSQAAIKYCNQEDLASILLKFFDVPTYGIEVATIVAQCLLSLSEDNPISIERLKKCESLFLNLLESKIDSVELSDLICLKVAIAGILINISNSLEINFVNIICKVVTVISDALAIDCKQFLDELVSILPHKKNEFLVKAKKKIQKSKRVFAAQQQALEFLANLCSGDQEDSEQSDIDSEVSGDETEVMEDESEDGKSYKIDSLSPEIIQVLNNCDILKKVWQKTTSIDKGTEEILEQNIEGKSVLRQLHTLRCSAYLCLNNLLQSLDIDSLGGIEFIYKMWIEIGVTIFRDSKPDNIELLESASAAMRAALQKLSEHKASVFNQLTLEDIEPLCNGERLCTNANVRRNLIRILGSLAFILINSNNLEFYGLIKHLSSFLLDTCVVEPEAWVIAECLDTLMDIYSEDESDQLAKEVQLIKKLQTIVPNFKKMVRQQKKQLCDNGPIVSTVNANIMRFIRYKENRIKHLK